VASKSFKDLDFKFLGTEIVQQNKGIAGCGSCCVKVLQFNKDAV
jgi:hypothetical protein